MEIRVEPHGNYIHDVSTLPNRSIVGEQVPV